MQDGQNADGALCRLVVNEVVREPADGTRANTLQLPRERFRAPKPRHCASSSSVARRFKEPPGGLRAVAGDVVVNVEQVGGYLSPENERRRRLTGRFPARADAALARSDSPRTPASPRCPAPCSPAGESTASPARRRRSLSDGPAPKSTPSTSALTSASTYASTLPCPASAARASALERRSSGNRMFNGDMTSTLAVRHCSSPRPSHRPPPTGYTSRDFGSSRRG